jgi:hypothetical protein
LTSVPPTLGVRMIEATSWLVSATPLTSSRRSLGLPPPVTRTR